MIFGDSYATGAFSCSAAEDLQILDDMDDINVEPTGPSNEDAPTMVDDVEEIQQTPRVTHNLNRTPSALRKRGRNAEISSAIRELVANSRSRLELFTTSSSSTASTRSSADESLIECVKALEALPNVDRSLYMRAINHIKGDADWRWIFFTVPDEKKMWMLEEIP